MMSFDDTLTRANFSFVYFLQLYLLIIFFDIFQWGGLNPQPPPSGYASDDEEACKTDAYLAQKGFRSKNRILLVTRILF